MSIATRAHAPIRMVVFDHDDSTGKVREAVRPLRASSRLEFVACDDVDQFVQALAEPAELLVVMTHGDEDGGFRSGGDEEAHPRELLPALRCRALLSFVCDHGGDALWATDANGAVTRLVNDQLVHTADILRILDVLGANDFGANRSGLLGLLRATRSRFPKISARWRIVSA
ncbi:hypothetical protein [Microbacterium sp. KNMS]